MPQSGDSLRKDLLHRYNKSPLIENRNGNMASYQDVCKRFSYVKFVGHNGFDWIECLIANEVNIVDIEISQFESNQWRNS